MRGYLLFSHGSLLCGAGQALDEHVERLSLALAPSPVEPGYLNYSEPDVETAFERLTKRSVTEIVVVPYFLVPGYFVSTSLPKRLAEVQPSYPSVTVKVASPLGVDSRLADALLEITATARTPKLEAEEVLAVAGRSCRLNSDCPLFSTVHCPRNNGIDPATIAIPSASNSAVSFDPSNAAMLVMVHGSPHEAANMPMLEVVEIVRQTGRFKHVSVGFMECNSPTIPEGIELCVDCGIETIVAVPYFLHMGTHTSDDLPGLLTEGQSRHPDAKILMTDYLGLSLLISDVLADRAREAF